MRYTEFKLVESKKPLLEAEARIDHAEDIIFWEGSKGAIRALEALRKLEQGGHKDVTIKWDGSPAIIFGRNENGEFILTDKSGWGAKGYDGRSSSAKDLEAMLLRRPGASNPDPNKAADYKQFAGNMKDIFDEYEKATPKEFVGFFKGDLLYYNTPDKIQNKYVFTPNIVTYSVKADSDIGRRIAQSKTGIVVHNMIDHAGNDKPIDVNVGNLFQGKEVFVVPPVTVSIAPKVDDTRVDTIKADISRFATAIDSLINEPTLRQKKITSLPKIFYKYINSKVDTSLENLGSDFQQWLQGQGQISQRMQQNVLAHISENKAGFDAMWKIVSNIQNVKDDIITQFDATDHDVEASIDGHGEGGEGYVLNHPQGLIKLVPREYFSRANRAKQR